MTLDFKDAGIKTWNNLKKTIPILIAMVLLVSIVFVAVPKEFYSKIFTKNIILDPIIGASIGSVAAGNPITSYIVGGELLNNGISLLAVLAFILAWVTVGFVQFPAESLMLGRKFAIFRNLISFVAAIVIAILMSFTLGLL